MQRCAIILLSVAMFVICTSEAPAQVDAASAYVQGKKAYTAGEFAAARDLFIKASQTDRHNPEVFLWLGKAEYQLGQVEKAMAAWTKTLKLAPEEPYAKKMLDVLRDQIIETAEIRISLVETLLKEKLYSSAKQECSNLLARKVLTDSQRVKLKTLQAELLLATGQIEGTRRVVQELLAEHPELVDRPRMSLLLGRAKMRTPGKLREGLRLLEKVAKDFKDTPAGQTASYHIIAFNLDQSVDTAGAEKLAKWIQANPDHPEANQARRRLLEAYFSISRQRARLGSELSEADKAALGIAAELFARTVRAEEALKLTRRIIAHLDGLCAEAGMEGAAAAGCETLLKAALPPSSRLFALRAMSRYQSSLALRDLRTKAPAGRLVKGPVPKSIVAVLSTYATITREFPAESAWPDQAKLAEDLRQLAVMTGWPAEANEPKACYLWAVEVALPVVEADSDPSAVAAAVKTVTSIINDCAKRQAERPSARGMASAISRRLVEALKPSKPHRTSAMLKHIGLLTTDATAEFNENLSAGRIEQNATLSETQKELLARLKELATQGPNYASIAVQKLDAHLQPWIRHKYYRLAEQAYTQLAECLPKTPRIRVQLAIARLWKQRVFDEHNRLSSAGLTIERRLDPTLSKALALCYELQGQLDEQVALLRQVRGVWDDIIAHYKDLEYYDVARQAAMVRPAEAAEAGETHASFALAELQSELAHRELQLLLKQYDAGEQITLTPAFKTAIEAYMKLISDYPARPQSSRAAAGIFTIAQTFEKHQAYDIAAQIYGDFAAFAAGQKSLSQAEPGQSSCAERAAMAAAIALDGKARTALTEQARQLSKQGLVPSKLSDEFAAALKAYRDFIEVHPNSILVGTAINRIMAIGLEYAKVDAWDVAEGLFAELISKGPELRRIERIEFCRGLCRLGKAMPDHARAALEAVAKPSERAEGPKQERALAAVTEPSDSPTRTGQLRPTLPSLGTGTAGPQEKRPEVYDGYADDLKSEDTRLFAAIRRHQADQAARVAQLREQLHYQAVRQKPTNAQVTNLRQGPPVLSEAEVARQEKAINGAYEIFQGIREKHPASATAEQSRGEIKLMIGHWRGLEQWKRAALLAERFLEDNPTDPQLPQLRLGIARDYLAWAARPVKTKMSVQLMLSEVARRFSTARRELAEIIADFPDEQDLLHEAQWDLANSFLMQARVVDASSRTLARGQYVRAAGELLAVADKYSEHPKIGAIPQMLWDLSAELAGKQYHEEAIEVWTSLSVRYPTHRLAQEAALRIAQTYQQNLGQPLRAAEAYQEVNIARGGNDVGIQNTIYQIGVSLKDQKRWIEALHVLEMFVESFPRHPQAGQALTTIGRIHQTNQAWDEAIAAYQRVIAEFPNGDWVKQAKWSIAECVLNLSRWRQALESYASYIRDYPQDSRKAEAERRVTILKDLARYQSLVDEKDQRKAFDAQYQIATIVLNKLSNHVKAIIEYKKVTEHWPNSHLADDALYAVGTTYLALGEPEKAREAARAVASRYPNSPLADDALFLVGKSYEDEANKLASVTRLQTLAKAEEIAQFEAYRQVQTARSRQKTKQDMLIQSLKKGGETDEAELQEARYAGRNVVFNAANAALAADKVSQMVETLTAVQLANRQDKINAALRKAVEAYAQTSKIAGADKAGDALLRMATIYDERLKDSQAAMTAWLEIVKQFSGTTVAEDASWRIAKHYEDAGQYKEAVEAYKAFLRNYRRSPKAGQAQFAIAESYEHLGRWVDAMDAYTNYINNFPQGPLAEKAREQITWIKAYRL